MSKYGRTAHMDAHVNGLRRARQRGIDAAAGGHMTQADNPYKRVEHRHEWSMGFADERLKSKREPWTTPELTRLVAGSAEPADASTDPGEQ